MTNAVTVHEDRPQTMALVRPLVKPAALIEAHKEVSDLIAKALVRDTDYGVIPGTKNPTLLKPGAERLCLAFGAIPDYEDMEHEIDHDRKVPWTKRKKVWSNRYRGDKEFTWTEESGESVGLYRYVVKCRIVQRDTGIVLATGLGSCSTMEAKYIDRPRECENTVLKMAQKRAFVAATLNAFGLSDRFTQDVEDQPQVSEAVEAAHRTPDEPAPSTPAPDVPTEKQTQFFEKLLREGGFTDAEKEDWNVKAQGIGRKAMRKLLDELLAAKDAKAGVGDAHEPAAA